MNQVYQGTDWAAVLELAIWDWAPERLQNLADVLPHLWKLIGVQPAGVLSEVADETLALAGKKSFLSREVFTELMCRRYESYLTRWFKKWERNAHAVEDLTQQIMLKFLENKFRSYDPSQNFRAYLRSAAYNLWVDEGRRRKPSVSLGDKQLASNEQSPEGAIMYKELAAQIERAIRELPPQQQQVMRAVLEDRETEDIARELGVPNKTVYQLLFKARRHIEKYLGITKKAKVGACR